METTDEKRKPSWRLAFPGEPSGGLRRTERVLTLLYDIYVHDYLHSGHAKALDPYEKTERLLYRMAQHKLVTRVTANWGWQAPPLGGSPPQLYELSELGAYDLLDAGMISLDEWSGWRKDRARSAGRPRMVKHQVANADVTVWLHQEMTARGYVLERGHELARARNPRSLIVPERSKPLVTDNTFVLHADGERTVLFIETDRVTEPYDTASPKRDKTIRSMFDHYLAYLRSGMLARQFGTDRFMQLTVTTGRPSRVEGIASRAQEAATSPSERDRFAVTNFNALNAGDLLSVPWLSASGSVGPLAF